MNLKKKHFFLLFLHNFFKKTLFIQNFLYMARNISEPLQVIISKNVEDNKFLEK